MSEQALRAFLNDLTAVCAKHQAAVFSSEDGLVLMPWKGWGFSAGGSPAYIKGHALLIRDVLTPDPADNAGAQYREDYHL